MVEQALAAQVLLWLIVLGFFFCSGQASLFHPVTVYLFFHGLVFVLRPVLVVLFGFDTVWNYMVFAPTPEDLMKSLAVSSLAMVVFCLACLAFGWSRVGDYSTPPRLFTRQETVGLVLASLLLAPVIFYSIHVVNSGAATGKMVGGTYIMTGSSGYINDAQVMGGSLICAWLAVSGFAGQWFCWRRRMFCIALMGVGHVGHFCCSLWQRSWFMPGNISAVGCRLGPLCYSSRC